MNCNCGSNTVLISMQAKIELHEKNGRSFIYFIIIFFIFIFMFVSRCKFRQLAYICIVLAARERILCFMADLIVSSIQMHLAMTMIDRWSGRSMECV